MDDLYRELILEHYKHPQNYGSLSQPNASFELNNPLCGDKIKIEFHFTLNKAGKKIIKDVKFNGVGCAISMASASLLTEHIKSMKIEDLKRLSKEDIVELLGVQLTPSRLKCALLPLEVAQKAA